MFFKNKNKVFLSALSIYTFTWCFAKESFCMNPSEISEENRFVFGPYSSEAIARIDFISGIVNILSPHETTEHNPLETRTALAHYFAQVLQDTHTGKNSSLHKILMITTPIYFTVPEPDTDIEYENGAQAIVQVLFLDLCETIILRKVYLSSCFTKDELKNKEILNTACINFLQTFHKAIPESSPFKQHVNFLQWGLYISDLVFQGEEEVGETADHTKKSPNYFRRLFDSVCDTATRAFELLPNIR
jgi:hypothetical protein